MANRILRSVGYGDLQGEVEKSLARITWLNLCLRLPGDMAGNQGLDAGSNKGVLVGAGEAGRTRRGGAQRRTC
jgi:hypothetical protein